MPVSTSANRPLLRALSAVLGAGALVFSSVGAASAATTTGSPIGNVDAVVTASGGVQVRGWVWDPDTAAPVEVRVVAGAHSAATKADQLRKDVARVFPAAGDYRGFRVDVPASAGQVDVCVTAVNVGAGSDKSFRCTTIDVPGVAPVGWFDRVRPATNAIRVSGWAADRDAVDQGVRVRIAVDGSDVATVTADKPRADVVRVFPDLSGTTGFDALRTGDPRRARGLRHGLGHRRHAGHHVPVPERDRGANRPDGSS